MWCKAVKLSDILDFKGRMAHAALFIIFNNRFKEITIIAYWEPFNILKHMINFRMASQIQMCD